MKDGMTPITPQRKEDFFVKMQKKCIDLIRQGHIYLNHAPKAEKYGLCQQIRNCEYEVYKLIIEGKKRYWAKSSLTKLDICHEQLRSLWRLFYDLKYFDYRHGEQSYDESKALRRYTTVNILINELGAMIGGVIKSAKEADLFK